MEYKQIRIISGMGSGPDQFTTALRGIAADQTGLIYAVGDSDVKVFDQGGKLIRQWPTSKPGYCVAVDNNGITYVGQAGQIEKYDDSGNRVDTWKDEERLDLVTSIAVHGENVLLADAQDRCIRRYDRQGKWLNDIGRDNNTKGFLIPNGHLDFAVDANGIIHAANPAKFRVERYSLSGELLGHFGKFGTKRAEDFPGCCNPTNLTLSSKGHVIVTEKADPRMKVFDADGKMLAHVGSDSFNHNCKNMDVAVDAQGNIYVVDTVQLHICVFAPNSTGEQVVPRANEETKP